MAAATENGSSVGDQTDAIASTRAAIHASEMTTWPPGVDGLSPPGLSTRNPSKRSKQGGYPRKQAGYPRSLLRRAEIWAQNGQPSASKPAAITTRWISLVPS